MIRHARRGLRRRAIFSRFIRSLLEDGGRIGDAREGGALIEKLEFDRQRWTAEPWTTSQAGVDIDAATRSCAASRRSRAAPSRRACCREIGSFGGLFRLDRRRDREPVLVASADGVGTKLKRRVHGRPSTTRSAPTSSTTASTTSSCRARGRCSSSTTSRPAGSRPTWLSSVVGGMARGCQENGCALLGGETAEMPGFYADGEYDLAGFIVGVVERERADRRPAHRRRATSLIGAAVVAACTPTATRSRGEIVFERLGLGVDSTSPSSATTLGEALLRAAPHLSAACSRRCSSRAASRAWRTSPAAASPTTCRACCRQGSAPRSSVGSWTSPPLFAGSSARRRRSPRDEMLPHLQHGHRHGRSSLPGRGCDRGARHAARRRASASAAVIGRDRRRRPTVVYATSVADRSVESRTARHSDLRPRQQPAGHHRRDRRRHARRRDRRRHLQPPRRAPASTRARAAGIADAPSIDHKAFPTRAALRPRGRRGAARRATSTSSASPASCGCSAPTFVDAFPQPRS